MSIDMNNYIFNVIGIIVVCEFMIYFTRTMLYRFKNGLELIHYIANKSLQTYLRIPVMILGLLFVSPQLQTIIISILIIFILLLYQYLEFLNSKYNKDKPSDYIYYKKEIRRVQYIWLIIAVLVVILKIF